MGVVVPFGKGSKLHLLVHKKIYAFNATKGRHLFVFLEVAWLFAQPKVSMISL